MTAQYQIIVQNLSSQPADFYAFQDQATFQNAGSPASIKSSCLAGSSLAPHATSGSQLKFSFDKQVYAGAIGIGANEAVTRFNARISLDTTESVGIQTSAAQPISLTPLEAGQKADNYSTMSLNPLGLSTPIEKQGLPDGYFGVEIPVYTPSPTPELFCGCATINQNGTIVLSSFVSPHPNSQLYCAPVAKYFVKVGDFEVGAVVPYDTSHAATCDFTLGYQVIKVVYNPDGTFTTTGS